MWRQVPRDNKDGAYPPCQDKNKQYALYAFLLPDINTLHLEFSIHKQILTSLNN